MEAKNEQIASSAQQLAQKNLSRRQLCDLELIMNDGFAPLQGFLNKADYESVVESMRLADGSLWPMPINLDVDKAFAASVSEGDRIELRDREGVLLAYLDIDDIWQPDKTREAEKVFGTTDRKHPAVHYLMDRAGDYYIGGKVTAVEPPNHYDFKALRHTPAELKAEIEKRGWKKVVAFQTRNPMHQAHVELTFRAAREQEANLLIHPVVGETKPGDIDHFSRVRVYEHVVNKYPENTAMLSLLPLAMRMGGPREALWHAIIRKNYGCTHFIVGRDHAGPGQDSNGQDFYGHYDAQELVKEHEDEIGIKLVPFRQFIYVAERAEYIPKDELQSGETELNLSGTEFRRRLQQGLDVPAWFSYPEVIEELRKTHPPRHQQGLTVFFTGLSGAGKSTVANALLIKLMEMGGRPVTLLDGDVVRRNLSSELGFSREHRDLNVRRIGYVASEITKNRGIAICAPIAPYEATRHEVRELIGQYGGFIEVHVSTPLEVCEQRDRKGLYAKARAGIIKEFTGISDPYEIPQDAELDLDTSGCSPDEAAQKIILKLTHLGYIK